MAPSPSPVPEQLLCCSLWLLLRARSREGWHIEPHKCHCIRIASRVSQNAELQSTVKCLRLPWCPTLLNEGNTRILGDLPPPLFLARFWADRQGSSGPQKACREPCHSLCSARAFARPQSEAASQLRQPTRPVTHASVDTNDTFASKM